VIEAPPAPGADPEPECGGLFAGRRSGAWTRSRRLRPYFAFAPAQSAKTKEVVAETATELRSIVGEKPLTVACR
jgi:hypothetical protein